MKAGGLAIFCDRCFEGFAGSQPVRLLDLQEKDVNDLLTRMKEAFEIARYLEDVYRRRLRPGVKIVGCGGKVRNSLRDMRRCRIRTVSSLGMCCPS